MRIDGHRKWIVVAAVVVVIAGIFAYSATRSTPDREAANLTEVLNGVADGKVGEIHVKDGNSAAIVHWTDGRESEVSFPPGRPITSLLYDAGIPSESWPPIYIPESRQGMSDNAAFVIRLLFIGGLFVLIIFFMRRMIPGAFGGSGKGKNRFMPIPAGNRSVTFEDVAGASEIKIEVGDIVEYLREPERFRKVGARMPRGLLLVGPPGTGKTLLARALAGEANASFFSVSGSEFVELYVGVGSSRVRELFKKAKENEPSIIFIDEIDAIGRRRGRSDHSSEYDQTLNQILVEMDGFDERSTVVVIAATNRADVLDSALLRPGRFDRKVYVDLPDREARHSILAVHARGKPMASGADLAEMAARTAGLTGADLANIINEAAILAARKSEHLITTEHLYESLDRTVAGPARSGRRFSLQERNVIAYHEAGHAVVTHLLPYADTVRKVSIVSRGQAGGFTMITPEEDRGLWTRTQLKQRLAGLLGGMAAEEIVFGDITTGSSNDLEQATSIASSMVQQYGMGRTFGLLSSGTGSGKVPPLSPQSSYAAEQEALGFVSEAFGIARSILEEHRSDLEHVALRLLEVETLEGDELASMIRRSDTAPRLAPSDERVQRPVLLPGVERDTQEPVPVRRRSRARRLVSAGVAALSFMLRAPNKNVGKRSTRATRELPSAD
jgi:cell division protease FtsH